MTHQEKVAVLPEETAKEFTRITLPPLAWYGGSWAYEDYYTPEPEPEPPPVPQPQVRHCRPEDFGPERGPGRGRGVILGRFMPPHAGHQYLVEFARKFVSQLTIFVNVTDGDPIAGELRLAWLRELFPDAKVVPMEHPLTEAGVPARVAALVKKRVPKPDYLFASESYGPELARRLNTTYVPVDPQRGVVPVSAAQVRNDPFAHWGFLPACVRAYYMRRVSLIGPESTGKSTLAWRLAAHYNTLSTDEYARIYNTAQAFEWQPENTQTIALGQLAAEEAIARRAYRVLFCDTDLLSVQLWCERLFTISPTWLREAASTQPRALYLVTRPDVPFSGPAHFDQPEARQAFYERCVKELTARKLPFVEISGDWDTRFAQACQAVDGLLT